MDVKKLKCKPVVTGSFVQPWLCVNWTDEEWAEHYQMLSDAGINLLIIQWTNETLDDKLKFLSFPSSYAMKDNKIEKTDDFCCNCAMLKRALDNAQKMNFKILIGLNISSDWWDEDKQRSAKWCDNNVRLANIFAKEIYDSYKKEYPDAFYGWYFSHELYSQKDGMENYWSQMLNQHLEFLTRLDSSLPFLISPFISSYRDITPKENEAMWTNLIKKTNFREGDIICPQDSYGASGYELDFIEQHLQGINRATAQKPYLNFWINTENFTEDGGSAEIERFVRQLEMEAKYATNLITFSYCHYYNPKLRDKKFNDEYVTYYKFISK